MVVEEVTDGLNGKSVMVRIFDSDEAKAYQRQRAIGYGITDATRPEHDIDLTDVIKVSNPKSYKYLDREGNPCSVEKYAEMENPEYKCDAKRHMPYVDQNGKTKYVFDIIPILPVEDVRFTKENINVRL